MLRTESRKETKLVRLVRQWLEADDYTRLRASDRLVAAAPLILSEIDKGDEGGANFAVRISKGRVAIVNVWWDARPGWGWLIGGVEVLDVHK